MLNAMFWGFKAISHKKGIFKALNTKLQGLAGCSLRSVAFFTLGTTLIKPCSSFASKVSQAISENLKNTLSEQIKPL